MALARCAEVKGWHAVRVLCALMLGKAVEFVPISLQISVAGPLPVAVAGCVYGWVTAVYLTTEQHLGCMQL
jgi:hypothetical protein